VAVVDKGVGRGALSAYIRIKLSAGIVLIDPMSGDEKWWLQRLVIVVSNGF
jgi:hypothetical protein